MRVVVMVMFTSEPQPAIAKKMKFCWMARHARISAAWLDGGDTRPVRACPAAPQMQYSSTCRAASGCAKQNASASYPAPAQRSERASEHGASALRGCGAAAHWSSQTCRGHSKACTTRSCSTSAAAATSSGSAPSAAAPPCRQRRARRHLRRRRAHGHAPCPATYWCTRPATGLSAPAHSRRARWAPRAYSARRPSSSPPRRARCRLPAHGCASAHVRRKPRARCRFSARTCDERRGRVLQGGVALAVQQRAHQHDGDELAGLGQDLRGVAAAAHFSASATRDSRCSRGRARARLMFFSASTPHAGPTVLLMAARQKRRHGALPDAGGLSSSHSPAQSRHTTLCAKLRNTTCVKRSLAAP